MQTYSTYMDPKPINTQTLPAEYLENIPEACVVVG